MRLEYDGRPQHAALLVEFARQGAIDGAAASRKLLEESELALQWRIVDHDLHAALKPDGALFARPCRATPQENRDRYGVFHEGPDWRGYMTAAGFAELDYYYRPAGSPACLAYCIQRPVRRSPKLRYEFVAHRALQDIWMT